MFPWRTRSALLVDFDNVHLTLRTAGRDDFAARIGQWLKWLEAGAFDAAGRRRRFLTKRVYWNGGFDVHRRAFEDAGFEAFACRGHTNAKKSSADIVITLDALDILGEYRALKEVVLLSMDTDFVPVVNRLQSKGVAVVTMGNEENSSAAVFRDHASNVISVADMRKALDYAPVAKGLFARRAKVSAAIPAPIVASPRPEVSRPAAIPAQPAAPVVATAPRSTPIRAPQLGKKANSSARIPPAVFDLDGCATRIVEAASASPGSSLSRATVMRVLGGLPGFSPSGARAWFGLGSYRELLAEIARRRPMDLRVHTYGNGGVALVYVGKAETAASV